MSARAPIVGSLIAGIAASVLLAVMASGGPTPTTSATPTPKAETEAPSPRPEAETETPALAPAPAPTPAPAPAPAPALAPASALSQALLDPNPFVARDAIAAAVDAKDLSALPALESVDLSKDGIVAAAAIQGVGKLAAIADPSAKLQATQTLDRWLRDETRRGTPDAVGNASIAIDALHDVGTPEAANALVGALDGGAEPLHLETRLVQTLDAMHAQNAASSIAALEARLRARTGSDELETELIGEAIAAADEALADLR